MYKFYLSLFENPIQVQQKKYQCDFRTWETTSCLLSYGIVADFATDFNLTYCSLLTIVRPVAGNFPTALQGFVNIRYYGQTVAQ